MDCSRGSLPVAKKRIKDPKAKLIERERERERESCHCLGKCWEASRRPKGAAPQCRGTISRL